MTILKFVNGSRDVEGNIVEITNDSSRLIIDFGMVGGFKSSSPKKLIKSHVLPNFPDLFTDQKPSYINQAIILTSMNVDNFNAAVYLRSDITIYASETSLELYKSLVENKLIQPISVKLKPLPQELVVGEFTVRSFSSDCGVKGSQSLLISDGEHSIGISGDVRLTGPNKDQVFHWIRKFNKRKIDLFLFDSTSYSFSDNCRLYINNENSLRSQFKDLIVQRRDLIVINVDPFNVDRLEKLFSKASHFERKLVLEEKYALVIQSFHPKLNLAVLKESINKKTTSSKFEVVSLDDIKSNPKNYVLQNSFENINYLERVNSGLYLHSNGFPKVSYGRDFEDLKQSLNSYNFQYIDFSASGHASKHDLVFLVDAVGAKQTVPWHSYHPELAAKAMESLDTEFILPKTNKKIKLE
ncbi:hypothetical protein [Companilactobacillus ginsenosidimutans]|uniref:Metallo-beta-lactamase domain-containing protein n=1 Tax=Companilactobacillus ginsenosidimutans TaxID=1007676 RepID=A0A0H4QJC4_9LACO|nr:hypothetical protein [Companilactobacillus ginsenosidimutans]AKP67146.1 hypothetical protein ABM34_06070 [Companilactobacillus ginsenosidimutans]